MGYTLRNEVGADRGDVSGRRSSGQDIRECIRNEVEQYRRGRGSLPEASGIPEKIASPSINRHLSVATRDQLHNPMDKTTIKALY